MTITLESIEAEQQRLAALIAAFRAQPVITLHRLPEVDIELRAGERYAGAALGDDGLISYHLILLPGQVENMTWDEAAQWAEQIGGTLPSRQEQALLYANARNQFEAAWYWSSETHAEDGSYAWSQVFYRGYQGYALKSWKGRARAVRRFIA